MKKQYGRARASRAMLSAALAAAGAMLPSVAGGELTEAYWLAPVDGNWSDATKWSTDPFFPNEDEPPGTSYLAIIAAEGNPFLVTINSDVTLDGFTLDSGYGRVEQRQGTLTVDLLELKAGSYEMFGGTIAGALISGQTGAGGSDPLGIWQGALDNVLLGTMLVVRQRAIIHNDLTLLNGLIILPGTDEGQWRQQRRLEFVGGSNDRWRWRDPL